MKKLIALSAACLGLQAAAPAALAEEAKTGASARSTASSSREQARIEQLLNKYEEALNTSDVNAAVRLYTDDGVFMAPENPAAVGTDVLKLAYTGVFQAIALKLKFQIAEVKVLSPEWALLRTTSTGVVKILANGAEVPGGNQELFVLRKTNGDWKIARYSFSSVVKSAR
jgi:uncharacterized protein (TIGR02246 family)